MFSMVNISPFSKVSCLLKPKVGCFIVAPRRANGTALIFSGTFTTTEHEDISIIGGKRKGTKLCCSFCLLPVICCHIEQSPQLCFPPSITNCEFVWVWGGGSSCWLCGGSWGLFLFFMFLVPCSNFPIWTQWETVSGILCLTQALSSGGLNHQHAERSGGGAGIRADKVLHACKRAAR